MKKRLVFVLLLLFAVMNLCVGSIGNNKTITLNFVSFSEDAVPPLRYYVGSVAVLPSDLSKDGHSFAGWFIDEQVSIPFSFKDAVDGMVLYAKWTPIPLKITLFCHDLKTLNIPISYGYVLTLDSDVLSEHTQREGYVFCGWFVDSSYSTKFEEDIVATRDIELYAKWRLSETYSIRVIDWDGTILHSTSAIEGDKLDKSFILSSPLVHLEGLYELYCGDEIIDLDTLNVVSSMTLNVVYNYDISDISIFNFTEFDDGYAVSLNPESDATKLKKDISADISKPKTNTSELKTTATKLKVANENMEVGSTKLKVANENLVIDAKGSGFLGEELFLPPTYNGKIVKATAPALEGQNGSFAYLTASKVYIPSTYSLIGSYSFYASPALEQVIFIDKPNIATESKSEATKLKLGEGAFSDCFMLQEVYLPVTLEYIEGGAFRDCSMLKEFSISSQNELFTVDDGNVISKDKKQFILYAPGKLDERFSLQATIESISSYAFYGAHHLKSIELYVAQNLKTIGEYAFYFCDRLEGIEIPDSVESLGAYAFSRCFELEYVLIGVSSRLESIGQFAFADSVSLTTFYIPKNARIITLAKYDYEAGVFMRCASLYQISVDAQNEYYYAMDGVLYDKSISTLKVYPAGKNSANYQLRPTTEVISSYAFYGNTYLKRLVFHEGITKISDYAFGYSGIEEIVFPSSLAEIGAFAFYSCQSLYSVSFLEGTQIATIQMGAFFDCVSLQSITILAHVPPLSLDQSAYFFDFSLSAHIYVPADCIDEYKKAWYLYQNQILPTAL